MFALLDKLKKREILIIVALISSILILNLLLMFYIRSTNYNNSQEKIKFKLQETFKELQNKVLYRVEDAIKILGQNKRIKQLFMKSTDHTLKRAEVDMLLNTTKEILNANAVYVLNQEGTVVASTNYGTTNQTFLKENYSFRPYFKNALAGSGTVYGAVGKTSGVRGIYFSTPIRIAREIKGVLVVKIGLKTVDRILEKYDNKIMMLSPKKVVFSSNQQKYLYQVFSQKSEVLISDKEIKQQFGDKAVAPLQVEIMNDKLKLNNRSYLYQFFDLNIQGWQLVALKPIESFFYTEEGFELFWIVFIVTLILGGIILVLLLNKFYREKLENELRKFSKIVEQSPVSVVTTDLNGEVEYVNQTFEEITGYDKKEIIGENINLLKSGQHDDEFYQELWDTVLSGETWEGEFYNQRKNGEYYWEKELITPLVDNQGQVESLIGIKEDITEEKKLKKELEFFAERDKLTQVYNRRAGYKILEEVKSEADKRDYCFTVAFLDINNLKEVNDVYGHEQGDQLIVDTVEVIKKTIRSSDYIVRFGGDEFLVVFKKSKTEEAKKVMNRIQDKLNKINQTGNYKYQMSISYGIESYNPEKQIELDELISRADDKMYQFKQEYKEKHDLPQR